MTVDAPPRLYGVSFAHTDRNWGEIAPRIRVFVDGVEQKEVVEYDCDAGTVLRNKLDADGKAQLTQDKSEVLRETVKGVVTVEWQA